MPSNCYREDPSWVKQDPQSDFPVKKIHPKRYFGSDGEHDPSEDIFVGETSFEMEGLPEDQNRVPITFQIEGASNIDEAFENFDEYATSEMGQAKQHVQQQIMQMQQGVQQQEEEPAHEPAVSEQKEEKTAEDNQDDEIEVSPEDLAKLKDILNSIKQS